MNISGKQRRRYEVEARGSANSPISAVDLFCGAGGLTHGLIAAGIEVVAGIDLDEQMRYAYTQNNRGAVFLCWDIARTDPREVEKLFTPGKYRLLAGCAPCQPFSKLTNEEQRVPHRLAGRELCRVWRSAISQASRAVGIASD